MSYSNGIGDWKQTLNPIAPAAVSENRQAEQTKRTSAEPAGQVQVDQTKLSSASELITKALEGSDVRSAKVAALQQSIQDGSYNVSSSDIADKMIQSLQG